MTVLEFGAIWLLSITLNHGSPNGVTVSTGLEFNTVMACQTAAEAFVANLGVHNAPIVSICYRQPRA